MSKLTPAEAARIAPVSVPTLYRDMKKGKLSYETNGKDRRLIDISELERVYGQLKTPGEEENGNNITETSQIRSLIEDNNQKIIDLLEAQIEDLKGQLEDAKTREETAKAREEKLTDLLTVEQEKTKILMLSGKHKRKGILEYFKLGKPSSENV